MNNEPVAWIDPYDLERLPHYDCHIGSQQLKNGIPLYTHPAKELDEQFKKGFEAGKEEGWKAHKFYHPAKTLTDEEILDIWYEMKDSSNDWTRYVEFARATLRKAQEK